MKNWATLEPDKYALVGSHRFTKGRSRKIDRVVIHHNAAVNWSTERVRDLWNNERQASAHYQVEANGIIGQIVNDSDTAWHATNADINARSIGIEHANISGPNRWQISDKTIEEGAHLVAALCKFYKLGRPQWGVNVFGHSQFASTSCPHQLAPGGEDHATYMKRAQYWYDQMTGKAAAKPAPAKKEGLRLSDIEELKKYIDQKSAENRKHLEAWIKGFVGPIGADVKDVRQQVTGSRDAIAGDLSSSYPGWDFVELAKSARAKLAAGQGLTQMDALAIAITPEEKEDKND